MNARGWRTFRGLEVGLVEHYGRTWWTSTARLWLWATTALLPGFVSLFLRNPAIVRFPIATMLCIASSAAGTQHERWIGHRFTWLVSAFAAVFVAIQLIAIVWP